MVTLVVIVFLHSCVFFALIFILVLCIFFFFFISVHIIGGLCIFASIFILFLSALLH